MVLVSMDMDIDQLLDSTIELANEIRTVKMIEIEIDQLLEKTMDWKI
ncbi:hypothetical protein [Mesobacillus harenae]|nr:hypothetical protein [Mesobacillus harenae]